MHSPVLIDYDPQLDLDDMLDEWELYPSDFFDEDVPTQKKRKLAAAEGTTSEVWKRRKLAHIEAIPSLSLGESLIAAPKVVWRSSHHNPLAHPVVEEGKLEKISLLKDWQERFKDIGQHSFFQMPRKTKKTMVAVVIERRLSQDSDRQSMPPPANTESKGLAAKGDKSEPKAFVNGTTGTASSLAKQRQRPTLVPKGNEAAKTSSRKPSLPRKGSQTITKGRKRKASELDEDDSEANLPNGHTAPSEVHDSSEQKPQTLPRKPAPTGRKRKNQVEETENVQPPAKRAASARNGVKGAGDAGTGTKSTKGLTKATKLKTATKKGVRGK